MSSRIPWARRREARQEGPPRAGPAPPPRPRSRWPSGRRCPRSRSGSRPRPRRSEQWRGRPRRSAAYRAAKASTVRGRPRRSAPTRRQDGPDAAEGSHRPRSAPDLHRAKENIDPTGGADSPEGHGPEGPPRPSAQRRRRPRSTGARARSSSPRSGRPRRPSEAVTRPSARPPVALTVPAVKVADLPVAWPPFRLSSRRRSRSPWVPPLELSALASGGERPSAQPPDGDAAADRAAHVTVPGTEPPTVTLPPTDPPRLTAAGDRPAGGPIPARPACALPVDGAASARAAQASRPAVRPQASWPGGPTVLTAHALRRCRMQTWALASIGPPAAAILDELGQRIGAAEVPAPSARPPP